MVGASPAEPGFAAVVDAHAIFRKAMRRSLSFLFVCDMVSDRDRVNVVGSTALVARAFTASLLLGATLVNVFDHLVHRDAVPAALLA